jgi:Flp pilus assembly protein TadG
MVLIAVSMVAVIGTFGVVIDGSNAFAQRRQMQNAADSAAMAGARALEELATLGEAAIWNAVLASATSNGSDPSEVTCRLTTDLLVDLGACPTAATGTATALRDMASGVRVRVGVTKQTSFVRIVGAEQFTARAGATGQIQAAQEGISPFILCATGTNDPRSYGSGQAIPILLPDDTINPNAVGTPYMLQDSNVATCGQSSSTFKGLSLDFESHPVPGPWDLYNGNHGANVSSTVVAGNSACRGTLTTGCIVPVPLCHGMTTNTQGKLHCVRFGGFRVIDTQGQSRIAGVLVDNVKVTGGQGGGHAQPGEIRVIKLSE